LETGYGEWTVTSGTGRRNPTVVSPRGKVEAVMFHRCISKTTKGKS